MILWLTTFRLSQENSKDHEDQKQQDITSSPDLNISTSDFNITIGAGGSAFNELGIGALTPLGLTFYDHGGKQLEPRLNELKTAERCEWKEDHKDILKSTSFTFAWDVKNKLFGEKGCTYIFGPQKGLKAHQLEEVDQQLRQLFGMMKEASDKDNTGLETLPGSGASGINFLLNINRRNSSRV